MAGDWMKIELELPDKPEVHSMAGMLNLDPDAVVGKLIRVWQWFNKHTVDGNAHGVTFSLVDRITGVTGFGESMCFVGWLIQNDTVLIMPKFDRHTSESAKSRALNARRQERHRNANVTQQALPREEKRRVIKPPISPKGDFDEFWTAYPKKVGKGAAQKIWDKTHPPVDKVLTALGWQKKSDQWVKDGGQFIPNPATYLNQKRWLDEPASNVVTGIWEGVANV